MSFAFALATPVPTSRPRAFATSVACPAHHVRPARRPALRLARMSANTPPAAETILEGPFDGAYGTWYLTQADADGVTHYRQALSVMSVSAALAAALAFTAGADAPSAAYDALFFVSTAAFGVALQKIHIYAKPLHKALKVLWAAGAAGALALAISPATHHSVVLETYAHPALMLAIGWQFVALTGLFIKEAFCFGRAEALSLIALIPILAGGHFVGVLPEGVERFGAVAFVALFAVFCFRKFGQSAKDDIGDMSVFQHLAKGGQA